VALGPANSCGDARPVDWPAPGRLGLALESDPARIRVVCSDRVINGRVILDATRAIACGGH
jgi:hypothetical protein